MVFIIYILFFLLFFSLIPEEISIDNKIITLEKKIIKENVKYSVVHNLYDEISLRGIDVRLNTLYIPSRGKNSDSTSSILLIHGVGSSSISYIKLVDNLCSKYNVYIIDLPGFGRSHVDSSYNDIVKLFGDSIDFYVQVLKRFIEIHSIEKLSICGHSLGGYIGIRFTNHYPQLVDKLILISPAGIFPLLGEYSMYWMSFFKSRVINLSRYMGKVGNTLADYLLDHESLYWYYLLGHPEYFGIDILTEKISYPSYYSMGAYWNKPVYKYFDSIESPVLLIYSDSDTIVPMQHGLLLNEIHNIPTKVLKNNGHNLSDKYVEITNEILNFESYDCKNLKATGSIVDSDHVGSYILPTMRSRLKNMYNDIRKLYNVSMCS